MTRKKTQRELIRRYAMVAVNCGCPRLALTESLILWAIRAAGIQCDAMELQRELSYLEDRKLVILKQSSGKQRTAELTDRGVELIQRAWEACRVGVMRAPCGTDAAIGRVVN